MGHCRWAFISGLLGQPLGGSTDRVVCGFAVWCTGTLGVRQARPRIEVLLEEDTEIVACRDLHLSRRCPGGLAKETLARLDATSKD